MRLIGAFLCLFLVILVSGTVSYIYLMWTNYWIRVRAMETKMTVNRGKSKPVISFPELSV